MNILKKYYGTKDPHEIGGFNEFKILRLDEYVLKQMIFFGRDPIYIGDRVKYIGEDSSLFGEEGIVVEAFYDWCDGGLVYNVETDAIIRYTKILNGKEKIIGEKRVTFSAPFGSLTGKMRILQRTKQSIRNKDLETRLRMEMGL